ncbi:hypothetical protein I6N95_15295 [Vagococcus sp. BWB3-3]|uniref:Uncharacterized protein n=1 Tax=Vagococcus allomyrinae TaxID=2794353 RepID=A0A940PCE4_9ENTE|nr:hypothetical protein [Vagococcus allomyrinae]MBP1042384.1 hypothetical protein [Vagococcus allomyrinae]
MELEKNFVNKNYPFGYKSNNIKKMMETIDYLELEKRSYSYYYYHEDYYGNLIYEILMNKLMENMKDDSRLDISTLQKDDSLLYKGEYYKYKGESEDGKGGYVLQSVKKVGNPVKLIVTEAILKNRVATASNTKTRKAKDLRKILAKHINLEDYNANNNKKIMIIADMSILKKIFEIKLTFGGTECYIGELCSAVYITKEGEERRIPHDLSYSDPMVYFCSSTSVAAQYYDDVLYKTVLEKIFILGNKFFKGKQRDYLYSLIDIHDDENIAIALFGSADILMQKDGVDPIKNLEMNHLFSPIKIIAETSTMFNFIPIQHNREFTMSVEKLRGDIEKIRFSPQHKYLLKMLVIYLRSILGQVVGTYKCLESMMIKISEYLEVIDIEDSETIDQNLYDLYANRFGYDTHKVIKNTLNSGMKVALVVNNELSEETSIRFRNNTNVEVFPVDLLITEDMLDFFDVVILSSMTATHRRKWVAASFNAQYYILYPQVNEKIFVSSIKNDRNFLNRITKSVEVSNLFDSYENAIETYIDWYKKVELNENEIEVDKDILEVEVLFESIFDSKLEKIIEKNISLSKENKGEDNNLVDINTEILLDNGMVILGTEYGKVHALEHGKLVNRELQNVKEFDVVVQFNIPYANEIYHDRLLTYSLSENESSEIIEALEYERMDIHWKRSLIEFKSNRSLKGTDLAAKFKISGYPSKSETFYNLWTNPYKMPMVPKDIEFISYVGKVIGDMDIEKNYQSYYEASVHVKENMKNIREKLLESIEGKDLRQIETMKSIPSPNVSTILYVEKIDYNNIPRYLTNKMIEGEEER